MFYHYVTIIVGLAIIENKSMNKKTIIPIFIVLIVLIGAGVLVARRSSETSQVSSERAAVQPVNGVKEDNSQSPLVAATTPEPAPLPTETKPPVVTGRFS